MSKLLLIFAITFGAVLSTACKKDRLCGCGTSLNGGLNNPNFQFSVNVGFNGGTITPPANSGYPTYYPTSNVVWGIVRSAGMPSGNYLAVSFEYCGNQKPIKSVDPYGSGWILTNPLGTSAPIMTGFVKDATLASRLNGAFSGGWSNQNAVAVQVDLAQINDYGEALITGVTYPAQLLRKDGTDSTKIEVK